MFLLRRTLRSKLMSSVMALSIFRSSLDLRSSRISRDICRTPQRVTMPRSSEAATDRLARPAFSLERVVL